VIQSSPSLAALLAQVPDPRAQQGRRHPWAALLLLVAVGLLTGANSQRAIARAGQNLRRSWLHRLGFRRPPSQPTLHRLLKLIDVERLETIVRDWLAELRGNWTQAATSWLDGIAIDGKTLRGARRLGAADVHLLSARSSATGVVLDQCAVPDATNELGAIETFLEQLSFAGHTITFDAAFTQWAVANAVLRGEGAYLMVVKGNQRTLQRDIAAATAHRGRCTGHAEQTEAAHGRIEHRSLWVAPALAVREQVLGFPGAHQILELTRRVVHKRSGQVHEETVYGVTSLSPAQADAPALLQLWREHWGIENGEHWVRDVVFGEDRSTTRTDRAPQVLAAFRNLVISLIHLRRGPQITASREYYATHLGVLFRHLGLG
jgi:predicted transposase YbfD/YdcC